MRPSKIQQVLSSVLAAFGGRVQAICKAIPGSPGWPTPVEWANFNQSVSGALLQPPPPGGVCHSGEPNYNAVECPAVEAAWTISWAFHEDNPISSAENNWNNDSCLPYPGYPCSGEGYPVYAINATTVEQIQTTINFARENNIRLNVKASGHDLIGRSVAPNSLSIWLHYMNGIQLHESYKPQGDINNCETFGPAISFSAGDNHGAVYGAASTIGMAVPVAGAPTVCYGGYVTGGGHSILGARYGLAADLVIDMTVVTPDGEVTTANACKNQDLFWALRGGGGATFGVILNMTMLLYPDEPTTQFVWGAIDILPNTTNFWGAATWAFTQYPDLIDQGLAGDGSIVPGTPGNASKPSNFGVNWWGFNLTSSQIAEMLEPIEVYVNNTWPGEFVFGRNVTSWPSYYAYWKANPDNTTPIGVDLVLASRLLDRKALANTNLKEYLIAATPPSGLHQFLNAGPGVHNKPLGLNSVSPAWRTAYSHTLAATGWNPLNKTMEQQALSDLNGYIEALTALAPTGAYVNEADPFQENYHEVFWGENYPRLLAIKRGIDPNDTFWCRVCVGNERWQEVGIKLCQV
ncbi:related to isoamyl alcohol oxidase [Phialocephala subalpina]|uniref:Related to isoamyl alcohol oxidase n=1 Tax=Phialocephala subalpina TaxID=576137 RepID=A0A1L7X036_9HELO|nr:related to isoamyl alcohol oxidase [Phialocephala subalpina]